MGPLQSDPMGTYEISLIIIGGVVLGLYLNGLLRLYRL